MKKVLAFAVAALVLASGAFAQGAPKRVLDQKTLDRFLLDFPKIENERASAGLDTKDAAGGASGQFDLKDMKARFESFKKDARAKALVAKYGWDEKFWDIVFVVSVGSYSIAMESFPPEYRSPESTALADQLKAAVDPADLALVRKNFPRISQALDFSNEGHLGE